VLSTSVSVRLGRIKTGICSCGTMPSARSASANRRASFTAAIILKVGFVLGRWIEIFVSERTGRWPLFLHHGRVNEGVGLGRGHQTPGRENTRLVGCNIGKAFEIPATRIGGAIRQAMGRRGSVVIFHRRQRKFPRVKWSLKPKNTDALQAQYSGVSSLIEIACRRPTCGRQLNRLGGGGEW